MAGKLRLSLSDCLDLFIQGQPLTLENEKIGKIVEAACIEPASLWLLLPKHTEPTVSLLPKFCKLAADLGFTPIDPEITLEVLSDRRKIFINLSLDELWLAYFPLCLHIVSSVQAMSRRFFLFLAGGAAAGKTTLSLALKRLLELLSIE